MANICNYEIRVKGSRNAGLLVYASMPCMDYKEVEMDESEGCSHVVAFSGDCKWSVNYGVTDSMEKIDISSWNKDKVLSKGEEYWECSLRAKSEALDCEIMVHYWSVESGFDQFDYYKAGKCIKQRKIEYDYDNDGTEFDWDTLEFVGHEGEYNNSVDGEEADADFLSSMFGISQAAAAYNASSDGDENSDNPIELLNRLGELLKQGEDMLEEAGFDTEADSSSAIGDTGFDMYNWTFTEGKKVKGKDFTIAIPDGFVKYDSGDERAFELVPSNCVDNDSDSIPVMIMCGVEQNTPSIKNLWSVHPNANAGLASTVGDLSSRLMVKEIGMVTPIFSTGWSDIASYTMLLNTTFSSYSYQILVLIEERAQMLRIQTHYMTDEQKANLNKSYVSWLHTMKFDKANKFCPENPIVDSKQCISGILKDDLKKFNDAVDQAKKEYVMTINGRMKAFQFAAEYDVLDEYSREYYELALNEAMEVREFYLTKFDALLRKPELDGISLLTREKMLKKLHDLDEDLLSISFDDDRVAIDVSEVVADIRADWKNQEKVLANQVKELKEAEKKKLAEEKKRKKEEKKKIEAERKAAEEVKKKRLQDLQMQYDSDLSAWKLECKKIDEERAKFIENTIEEEIKKRKRAITSDKEDIVAQNTRRIETQTNIKLKAESDFQNAGFFKYRLKKELSKKIEDTEAVIEELKAKIQKAENDYNLKLSAVSADVANNNKTFIKMSESSLPYPPEPQMPVELKRIAERKARKLAEEEARKKAEFEKKRKEEEHQAAIMTEIQRQNEIIKKKIYDILHYGAKFTVTDICERIGSDYSNQKISRLCHDLVKSGEIQEVVYMTKRYYYIKKG